MTDVPNALVEEAAALAMKDGLSVEIGLAMSQAISLKRLADAATYIARTMPLPALAGEAGTAETTQIGLVHEHATAQPERPTVPAILPNKERPQ